MTVAIVAYGITEFSKNDIPIEEVLLKSTKNLFDNTPQLKQNDIDAVLVSTNNNSKYLGAILSEMTGIQPKIAHSVESLCNSGTNAIISGYSYIKAGLADTVLISGAERYDSPGQILEWDNSRGSFKHPIFWASIFSSSYKRQNHVSDEDLAVIAAKNHKNAQNNPYAISKKAYSVEEILKSEKITDDLRLLDCSRPCTGGASILLCAEHISKKFTGQPVWIKGIGQKTIAAGFTKNPSYYSMQSTRDASKIAYDMAKIKPTQINVAEIHDAFTVCEPMALESLGFVKEGMGCTLSNEYYETDNKRINPRGGLIGSGHPLGATGIAQTIEITQQLQSCAGKRQVENSKIGLVHNMSAAATSSTVLVLGNEF